jgi:hypothetical protein
MTRQEIMQQLAELDKQINAIAGSDRVGQITVGKFDFPTGNYIGALFFAGVWWLGGMIQAELHRQYSWIALILAAVFLLSALWRTFRWLTKPRLGADRKMQEAMDKVRGLQIQRQELQRRLKELG